MTKYFYIFIQSLILFFNHSSLGRGFSNPPLDFSGLSSDAIPRNSKLHFKKWSSLKNIEGTKNINIQLLHNLNIEATNIWNQLVECSHGDAEKARLNYISKNSSKLCENLEVSHEIHNKVMQLTADLLSIANSNEYKAWFDAHFSLPPLHPLLSQKMLEILANSRINLLSQFSGNLSTLSTHLEILRCELSWMNCNKRNILFIKQYASISRILGRSSNHCFNYGLLPNQSLYLFANKYMHTGEVYYDFPYEDLIVDNKKSNFSFTFKGQQIRYTELSSYGKNGLLPNFIEHFLSTTDLSQRDVHRAIQNHQKQRHYLTKNSIESFETAKCWENDNIIKNGISQFSSTKPLKSKLIPYIEQYSMLFQYYNQAL